MSVEFQRMVDDIANALPDGGPTMGTEVHVARAYYDRMRRMATPTVVPGMALTAFGIPVVIDDSLPEDPGFKVVQTGCDTPAWR